MTEYTEAVIREASSPVAVIVIGQGGHVGVIATQTFRDQIRQKPVSAMWFREQVAKALGRMTEGGETP